MKNIRYYFFIIYSFICINTSAQNGSVQICQLGKIHYYFVSGNHQMEARNSKIAKLLNTFLEKKNLKDTPQVLLYLFDKNPNNSLNTLDEVSVSFEKYEGEFLMEHSQIYGFKKPNISILISLSENHEKNALNALKYAIRNIKKLQNTEEPINLKIKY